jgi:hypothetical protein
MRLSIIAAAMLAAGWLLSPPAVNAQAQQPSVSEPAPEISDQKLDATAAAIIRVAVLKEEYQQRINNAPPAEKERLAGEAMTALVKAVTDQGLAVEEYSSILEVAQTNPEVREKIRQRIRPSDK